MPDLLVRDIDPDMYERLRQQAKAQGKSLAETARDLLADNLKPSRQKIWAAADDFRMRIGSISGDSTADIREWRDYGGGHGPA